MRSVDPDRLARSIVKTLVTGEIRSVRQIKGRGVVNRVFVVRAARDTLVVRFPAAASVRSDAEYRKEAWCIRKAGECQVTAPPVLAVGRTHGRPYMVQRFIEGRTGEEIDGPEALSVHRTLGRYARAVSRIEVTGFGPELVGPETGRFTDRFAGSWLEQIDYHVRSLNEGDRLQELGAYPPEFREELGRRFLALRALPWRTALRHGDPTLENVVVDRSGTIHLLDWGQTAVDVYPEAPLAALLRRVHRGVLHGDALEAFFAGMGVPADWDDIRDRVEGVALLKAFDLVRWALDRAPRLTGDYAARARTTLEALSDDASSIR